MRKKFIIPIIFLLSFLFLFIPASAWINEDYSRCKTITLPTPNGSLTNYEIRINVTWDSDMQDDMDDIRFYNATSCQDATGTELSTEKVIHLVNNSAYFDSTLLTWSAGKTITMLYGNSTVSKPTPTSSWNDYVSVYHHAETSGTTLIDSVGNYNCTNESTNIPTQNQTGTMGISQAYSSKGYRCGDLDIDLGQNLTFEMWYKFVGDTSDNQWLIQKKDGTQNEYSIYLEDNTQKLVERHYDNSNNLQTYTTTNAYASTTNWTYLHARVNFTSALNDPMDFFINGTRVAGSKTGSWTQRPQQNNGPFRICGGEKDNGDPFYTCNILVDEVRISNISLSNAKIVENSQLNNFSRITFGAEEKLGGITVDLANVSNTSADYLDTIYLYSNITTNKLVKNVTYFIIFPNSSNTTLYNNTASNYYNSTTFQLDQYGVWQFNITPRDNESNADELLFNYSILLGNISTDPSSWTFSQVAGTTDSKNITIYHNGTSWSGYTVNVTGELSNLTRFNWTATMAFNVSANTNYSLILNITSNATETPNGTYTGNLTITKNYDSNVFTFPISMGVSGTAGNITPSPTSKSTTMYSTGTSSWNLTINNSGGRTLEGCNTTAQGAISSFTTFTNGEDYDITTTNNGTIIVTYTTPAVGTYSGSINVTCKATIEGGYDSEIINPIDVTVLESIGTLPSGGGAVTTIIEGVVCGDEVCDAGETSFNCPQDCAVFQTNVFDDPIVQGITIMIVLAIVVNLYQAQVKKTKTDKRKAKINLTK